MRVQKLKSHQVHFSQNHNERNHKNYSNPDIDSEKSKDNYHLVESKNYSKDTEHIIQKNYKSSKNIRKDAVKNVEIIFTSDKDFFDKLNQEEEKKYFNSCLEFAKEQFGEKNIFSAVVHKDETTPHMHVNFVPLKNGKLTAKEIIGNRKDLEQMQDKFFQKVSKEFPDLERGIKKNITNKNHLTLKELKKRDIQELEKHKSEVSLFNMDKQDITNIYNNAKPTFLNSSKVIIDKKDLKKIAQKAIKSSVADRTTWDINRENKKLKNENAYLKQENKTVQDLKSKNKKLEDDYWDLDLKKRLQEKDFSKEKEIFSKFVESSNSLKIQYYNFKKELKEKEKVKVRGKSQGMER